jgi:N-acetylglucosamine kinase-like BadF-type ATPase
MTDFVVIESGGSKSSWAFGDYKLGLKYLVETVGLHPQEITQQKTEIIRELLKENGCDSSTIIYFYGAGCGSSNIPLITSYFKQFSIDKLTVKTDLEGACIALLKKSRGYAAILGTGAIAAEFDGEKVIQTYSGLGYLLGDEGSGFDLGKRLLRSYFNSDLPQLLQSQIEDYFEGRQAILTSVYSAHGRFKVAGLAKLIHENKSLPEVNSLIHMAFEDFYEHALRKFHDIQEVSFIGSIAYYFQDELHKVLSQRSIRISAVHPSAIHELFLHHWTLSNK